MWNVSVETLRQKLSDSRIRLNSDPPPKLPDEFLAMTWKVGFLDGASVHFNGNLNSLIGGHGTGKSTESKRIRYVRGIDTLGEGPRARPRTAACISSRNIMGPIDSRPVRELAEEALEGGKDAFEMRRSKYGF